MDVAKIPEPWEEAENNNAAAAAECVSAAPVKPMLPLPLVGLEAGVLGGLAMLALLILNSRWHSHPWWSIPNLLGSTFYKHRAFHMGLGMASASGIALHLMMSGLAGIVFALLIAGALSRTRSTLLGIAAGLVWYYAALHLLFPRIGPLVSRYAPEPATLLAYILFGICLGRFPYRAATASIPSPAAAMQPQATTVEVAERDPLP